MESDRHLEHSETAHWVEEPATVMALETDAVWVETIRRSACGACAAKTGCGHHSLQKYFGRNTEFIRVLPGTLNPAELSVGDEVVVGIPDRLLLQSSARVYLMPLVLCIVMAVLAAWLPAGIGWAISQDWHEALQVLAGLGGFVLGFYWNYRFSQRHRQDPRYQPLILRRESSATPDLFYRG